MSGLVVRVEEETIVHFAARNDFYMRQSILFFLLLSLFIQINNTI